ncbi:MAG: hypothetical protein VCA12_15250, partial [Pseudomonadales bacterium]
MKQSTQLIGNKLLILLLTPIFYVSNATNAYSADSSYVVEEIVVTARKREENMQDVPAAVSAF